MRTKPARRRSVPDLISPYRVASGRSFSLARIDPDDTLWFAKDDKDRAQDDLKKCVKELADLQDKLYAQDRWSLLLIFQAMDAAGKDSAIKHVFSGINPQGCHVTSFKAPSQEELDHDYMWRCLRALPERGRIGIFNRSYYEEVLVVRVHDELLAAQKLPPKLVTPRIWDERFEDIRNFERYLARNGTVILKFFLHVSREEQRKRFLERLDEPEKNWKFAAGDVRERAHWNEYMRAYEQMIRHTATSDAPWFVVPADNKWFTRLVVSSAIVDAMSSLHLHYPRVSRSRRRELDRCAQGAPAGERQASRPLNRRQSVREARERQRLDVMRLRKEVERQDRVDTVSGGLQEIQVAGKRAGAAGEVRHPHRPQLPRKRLRDLAVEPGAWRVDICEPLSAAFLPPCPDLRQPLRAGAAENLGVRRVPGGIAHRLSRELDPERSGTRSGPEAQRRAVPAIEIEHARALSGAQMRGGGRERLEMQCGQRLQEGRRAVHEPERIARFPGAPDQAPAGARKEPPSGGRDADAATVPRSRLTPDRRAPRRARSPQPRVP